MHINIICKNKQIYVHILYVKIEDRRKKIEVKIYKKTV